MKQTFQPEVEESEVGVDITAIIKGYKAELEGIIIKGELLDVTKHPNSKSQLSKDVITVLSSKDRGNIEIMLCVVAARNEAELLSQMFGTVNLADLRSVSGKYDPYQYAAKMHSAEAALVLLRAGFDFKKFAVSGYVTDDDVEWLSGLFKDVTDADLIKKDLLFCLVGAGLANRLAAVVDNLDVNVVDQTGLTPLQLAAKEGRRECVKILLKSGADINARNSAGLTALWFALFGSKFSTAKLLVQSGANLRIGNETYDQTLFHSAVSNDRVDWIKFLCEESGLQSSSSVAAAASGAGSSGVVDLVEEVNLADRKGVTPLHIAAARHDVKMVQALLEVGANPRVSNDLLFSVLDHDPSCFEVLLKAGAHYQFANAQGFSLALVAAFHGYDQCLKLLFEFDREEAKNFVKSTTVYQETPLYYAAKGRHLRSMQVLLDHGADVNAEKDSGATPLHAAVESKSLECVQLLLARRAQVNVRKKTDLTTPLHIAAEKGNRKIVEALLDHGADATLRDENDETAADCARAVYREDLAEFIEERMKAAPAVSAASPAASSLQQNSAARVTK